MKKEIRISGSGGQGVVLAGIILAEAAGIFEDKFVLQAQDYGGQMRGGAVRVGVIIADNESDIEYPDTSEADILVALTQEAADRWTPATKADGIIIYDSTFVNKIPKTNIKFYQIPLTRFVREQMGKDQGANMAALGMLSSLTGVVSLDALKKAVAQRVPAGTKDFNIKALDAGAELAGRY